MKPTDLISLRNLIVEGMKISAQKLLQKKKKLGQNLVVSENGIIKVIETNKLKQVESQHRKYDLLEKTTDESVNKKTCSFFF